MPCNDHKIQTFRFFVSYPDTTGASEVSYRTRIHPGSRRPCIVPGYIQGLEGHVSYRIHPGSRRPCIVPDTSRVSEASYRTRIHPGSRRPVIVPGYIQGLGGHILNPKQIHSICLFS